METVIGYPFVSHVDQSARPTLELSFLDKAFVRHFTNNDCLIRYGYYKTMGYTYDFRPYLKRYVYKQYGEWREAYAPNKKKLREVTYGRIEEIVELKNSNLDA